MKPIELDVETSASPGYCRITVRHEGDRKRFFQFTTLHMCSEGGDWTSTFCSDGESEGKKPWPQDGGTLKPWRAGTLWFVLICRGLGVDQVNASDQIRGLAESIGQAEELALRTAKAMG